jgi:hypothetical protein
MWCSNRLHAACIVFKCAALKAHSNSYRTAALQISSNWQQYCAYACWHLVTSQCAFVLLQVAGSAAAGAPNAAALAANPLAPGGVPSVDAAMVAAKAAKAVEIAPKWVQASR